MPAKGKYTPERIKAITDAVLQGVPYRHAAAIAGITETTFYEWMNKKPAFAEAIKEAEAKAVAGRIARIRLAEGDHWQAAAWWLERKYPQEFGRTVQEQQHSGSIRREFVLITNAGDEEVMS
jgi:transposase